MMSPYFFCMKHLVSYLGTLEVVSKFDWLWFGGVGLGLVCDRPITLLLQHEMSWAVTKINHVTNVSARQG